MGRGVVYIAWLKRRTRSKWGVGKREHGFVLSSSLTLEESGCSGSLRNATIRLMYGDLLV